MNQVNPMKSETMTYSHLYHSVYFGINLKWLFNIINNYLQLVPNSENDIGTYMSFFPFSYNSQEGGDVCL